MDSDLVCVTSDGLNSNIQKPWQPEEPFTNRHRASDYNFGSETILLSLPRIPSLVDILQGLSSFPQHFSALNLFSFPESTSRFIEAFTQNNHPDHEVSVLRAFVT